MRAPGDEHEPALELDAPAPPATCAIAARAAWGSAFASSGVIVRASSSVDP